MKYEKLTTHRHSSHTLVLFEGIVALGWIVEKRLADFVTDTLGGAQYYRNKVLKDYKEKCAKNILLPRSGHCADDVRDKSHTKFIQAYCQICKSLIAYIK